MAFSDDIEALGFVDQGATRRGGSQWLLEHNRFLSFMLHRFEDHVVFTWALELGEFFLERGMQIGAAETSFQELYPRSDVKLPVDSGAVRTEIARTLRLLQFDFSDPSL